MISDYYERTQYHVTVSIKGESQPFLINSTTPLIVDIHIHIDILYQLDFWGKLLTPSHLPIYQSIVQLLVLHTSENTYFYHIVAETLSDESGFYHFHHTTSTVDFYCIAYFSRFKPFDKYVFTTDLKPLDESILLASLQSQGFIPLSEVKNKKIYISCSNPY